MDDYSIERRYARNKPNIPYYTSKKKRPVTPSSFQKMNNVLDLYASNDAKKFKKSNKKKISHQNTSGEENSRARKSFTIAFNKDKEFYAFLRSMDAYKNTLADPNTRLILSPNSDFFRFFDKKN